MATAPTPTPPLASATNGNPTRRVTGTRRASRGARASAGTVPGSPRRGRSGAVWTAVGVAVLLLAALVVFMLQNTQAVLVSFLGLEGTVPLAVALLIAGVGVGVVVLIVGAARSGRRQRRSHRTE
ncbi:hypothetical protein AAG589_02155 [Isoptericola sp. F-RaC21]|uniref:hypothetical protein n=1 Tax=Isoptericola sp. F-RaC21 TaxID=3141452 RepID=UPI00315C29C4